MQLIERNNIDTLKWDALVGSASEAGCFSFSWYLDACAENWCVLTNSDYTFGIALPYTVRAGVEVLYTPIFVRYLEVFGVMPQDFEEVILKRFREIQLASRQPLNLSQSTNYVHQQIDATEVIQQGSQAKRSLKKAAATGLHCLQVDEPVQTLDIIHKELEGKYGGLDASNLNRLDQLVKNALQKGVLRTFEVLSGENCVGGVICLERQNQLMYLKGTVSESAMKNGGMYLALNSAITYAREKMVNFDFGGSRIEGVKHVNNNLGGKDVVYYAYFRNDGPLWFRTVKRMKRWIRR